MATRFYPKYVFEKKISDDKWQSVLDGLRQQERVFVTEKGVLEKLEKLIARIDQLVFPVMRIVKAIASGIKDKDQIQKFNPRGVQYHKQIIRGHIQRPFRTRSEQMMAALFIRDKKLIPFLQELERVLDELMVVSREEIKKDEALALRINESVNKEKRNARSWSAKPIITAEKDLIEEERKERSVAIKLEKEEFEFLHHVRLFYSIVEDLRIKLEKDLIKLRNEYRQDNWYHIAPALAERIMQDLRLLMQELKKYGERLQRDFERKTQGEKFLEQLMRKIDLLRRKTVEVKSLVARRKDFTYY